MTIRNSDRDSGMTLIELLVSVMVIGGIATVLSSAVVVVLRQQPATQAAVDVARWEQALALWLPNDIASASDIQDGQLDAPCPSAECTFGVNALLLSWNDGANTTKVSYRYGPSGSSDGSWQLNRIECTAGSCDSHVVLRDLSPPRNDDGSLIPWSPGDVLPDDVLNAVIDVTVPLQVGSSDPTATVDSDSTTAQRIVVRVNGAPGPDGIDRSSSVSLTAGGVSLGPLEPASFDPPRFTEASSGCGGPITLIVDESGSIGGDIGNVRTSVRGFVNAFDGTPTKLQIVRMDTRTVVLGAGGGWNHFYDLSEPSDVEQLVGADGNSGDVSSIVDGGWTNWEDAMNRVFYAQSGDTYEDLGDPNAPPSELVVFFTDGLPTRDRLQARTTPSAAAATVTTPDRFDETGNSFSPRGWWRADAIVDQFRGDSGFRMIGLGVGTSFASSTTVSEPGWPTDGSGNYQPVPNEAFLGNLVAGGDPSNYNGGSPGYNAIEYDAGWGDVSSADVLIADNYAQFATALTQIALAECGGTLTVQTRDGAGNPADADITYSVGGEQVTTTRIQKARTFQVDLSGVPSRTVELVPQDLTGTGYSASGWGCRAGGADIAEGAGFDLIEAGNPAAGVSVTVSSNAAVSCTLAVTP